MDGGLNETTLWAQVDAMATTLRPHRWTHILHDYGALVVAAGPSAAHLRAIIDTIVTVSSLR